MTPTLLRGGLPSIYSILALTEKYCITTEKESAFLMNYPAASGRGIRIKRGIIAHCDATGDIEKGNGDSFYEQLERLNEAIKKEWVLAGNPVAEFQELGPKLLIILDNASYHKKQEILEKIKQQLPNIWLEFLPAYSPDFNLVELASAFR